MPVNKHHPLTQVMDAVDSYIEKTGRRVTLEYIMIEDVNVGEKDAADLVRLARGRLVNINLIPYNPVEEIEYRRPSDEKIARFHKTLVDQGLTAVIREERGADIEAACGQLQLKMAARRK
jgi:23S rRNA (adenine2503-C2)-methyltransferase